MGADARAEYEYDVVVVGGGPVGTTLAALLGQAGMRVFVGEASTDVYPLPRAAHFDHEVMRIFQQLGIADAVMPWVVVADRYVFRNQHGDVLLDFDLRRPEDTGWHGYMMHQPGIENAIRGRIADDPRVTLRTGIRFHGLEQDEAGVRSTWQAAAIEDKGDEIVVRSRYLVGCDGAWSPVREAIGGGLDDLAFDEPWLVLDLLVDDDNDLPKLNIQLCDPERPTTYVVMGAGRRRFEFMLKAGDTAESITADATIDALLKPWMTHGVSAVERKAVYRFHALVAQNWRDRRVFLAGDAAHQMPPFAGQGMCSGIRDAAALAWRLPLACAAGDDGLLLDSYQAEREPHVRAITAAAIATGRVVCTLDPAAADARDAAMLAARAAGAPPPDISSPPLQPVFALAGSAHAGERFFQPVVTRDDGVVVRLDDVLGPGAWLIGDAVPEDPLPPGLQAFLLHDARLTPFRAVLERWLAEAGAAAVLVRADRYVFGTGAPDTLVAAYARCAGLSLVPGVVAA